MTKRLLAIGLLVVCVTWGFPTGAFAEFIAKTSTVHTSTGGATTVTDVNLINGHTSLGTLFINNVTTNGVPLSGTTSAVAVGSNLLASYGKRTGGGVGAVYNPAATPVQPIVAVFALSGVVAPGGGNVFIATGGRVGFFSIPGSLGAHAYDQFNPITWGATNASGTALLTPIAVWDLKPAEPVSDPGDAPGGGGPGMFNLDAVDVNQISVNSAVGTATQGFLLFKETGTFTPSTLSGNSFISVTGNAPPPPVVLDEGLVSRADGSLLIATATNTGAISPSAGLNALNTIANQLGGLPDLAGPGTAFATAFGTIGSGAGSGTDFNPSSGAQSPNTADSIFTFGVTASPGVQVPFGCTSTFNIDFSGTQYTDCFRDLLRGGEINAGPDLGGTGHTALNFSGGSGASGSTWLTVYDQTPAVPDEGPTFGPETLCADILIQSFNNSKGAGVVALLNEGMGKKGLALLLVNAGNSDQLLLATVDGNPAQAGKLTGLMSMPLGSQVFENTWYRLIMTVDPGTPTVTAKVFRHTTATDPNSPSVQIGGTLTYSPGSLPAGVTSPGENGVIAVAVSAIVNSSVTNFSNDPSQCQP